MSELVFSSRRVFRVWLYSVGHSTLLLRSLGDGSAPRRAENGQTRIDMVFKPVIGMCLATTMPELSVFRLDPAAAAVASREVVQVGNVRSVEESAQQCVFALSWTGGAGWVVCSTVAWHEDHGGDADPSHFSVPRLVWE